MTEDLPVPDIPVMRTRRITGKASFRVECAHAPGPARIFQALNHSRGSSRYARLSAAFIADLVLGKHQEDLVTLQTSDDELRRLGSENAELRRLLGKHQWAGLTPVKSNGVCPECLGTAPPAGKGHRPGCALAKALAKAR
jgi:hypothetical protein